MTAKNLQNLKSSLEDSGFVHKEAQTYRWDTEAATPPDRHLLPWHITAWNVEDEGPRVLQKTFAAQLQHDLLLQNFEELLRERFPSFRAVALEEDRDNGFWLLIEFLDKVLEGDQSRLIEEEDKRSRLPHGLAGLHLNVIQALGQFTVFMTKHFFLGNVPGQVFMEFPQVFNQAAFGSTLKDKTNFNFYICTIRAEEIRAEVLRQSNLRNNINEIVYESPSSADTFRQVRLAFSKQGWKLDWSQTEDMPELVVPPIEVLEQKEVARRFQRLDELILLEDYRAALSQCQEFLKRNPHSLYLVRRLAFLSLWAGLDLDQKHLDLMTKYDPNNLMTLSLWVKKGLFAVEADILLENLSKLGNTLGMSVLHFENLDITSLTLPEMLGDAWNRKDDQRAVACYERVLHTRGEIPRILVKLIRLMRDIDDPHAEESYIDRLLSCEVPTRTRAAIYFRLAEIKQTVDHAEACQWALKSWQTNRPQVRYALLAANLLILLGRAQDAVHVLVETSELLVPEEPMESRLQLEMRIATVWLENMHRLDLASERISRAREIAGNDPEAYDTILALVERLDEPALVVEILEQGMAAAAHAGDQDRKARFVQTLLDIAEGMEDNVQAVEIFTLVLTTTLLNVGYTYSIFAREGLDLPFPKIAAAMEKLIDELDDSEQAPYFQVLGDLSLSRGGERVLHYYEKALQQGILSQQSFEFLDEYYSRNGMNSQRYALLQKKFTLANEHEKNLILRELYYFDEGVSNQEKDSYALQIFVSDVEDTGPLEERLKVYEGEADGSAITTLVERAVAASPVNPALNLLVKKALVVIDGLEREGKSAWSIQLLNKLRELGEEPLELARLTVIHLWKAGEKSWVRGPLEQLITRGEIPSLPPGEMLAIIDNDQLKIDLLLQLADRSPDFEETLAYERDALRITRGLPAMQNTKLDIQVRLAAKIEFTLPEITDYLKDVKASGKDTHVLRVLAQQMRLHTKAETKGKLLGMLAELFHTAPLSQESQDIVRAAIIDVTTLQSVALKLSWLERFGFDKELHSLSFARSAFADHTCWQQQASLCLVAQHLMRDPAHSPTVKAMVNDFLKELIADGRAELLRAYLDDLTILSIMDKASSRAATEHFAWLQDGAAFQRFWWQSLVKLDEAIEAKEFLAYSRQVFTNLGTLDTLLDKLSGIVDQPHGQKLNATVVNEIRYFYAEFLMEQNRDQRKAMSIFETLIAQTPNDTRLWGALIVLYRELNQETDLYELLNRVLPSLKKDPKPLKEYQLSVNGLQQEMAEIGHRMGLLDHHFSDKPEDEGSPSAGAAAQWGTEEESMVGPSGTFITNAVNVLHQETKTSAEASSDDDEDTRVNLERPMAFPPDADNDPRPENLTMSSFVYRADSPESAPLHTTVAPLPEAASMSRKEPPPPSDIFSLNLLIEPTGPSRKGIIAGETAVPDMLVEQGVTPPVPSLSSLFADDKKKDDISNRITQISAPEEPMEMVVAQSEPTEMIVSKSFDPQIWRQVARSFQAEPGLTEALLDKPLPELTEQTVALQVSALLENRLPLLERWTHRIWRKPEEIFFELRWTDRMGREMFHPGIKSPLARLLKTLYPIFMQQFASAMNLVGIAERLKTTPEEISRQRKLIEWQDDVVQRSNLRYYSKYLTDNGYHLFHMNAIEDRLQFDLEKREIYIDRNHFLNAPPSHIFHRLTFLIRAVSLDYYPFLNLTPGNAIFPFLMKCKRSLEQTQAENLKRMLGVDKDPLKMIMAQAKDRDYLDQLFKEVGTVNPEKITKTVSNFVDQIYRLNLAETLDLVGMIEAITNEDFLSSKSNLIQQMGQSLTAKSLIMFAADLRFGEKN